MGRVSAGDLVKGVKGVEIHGSSLRIVFTYRGVRCRESLGIAPTKANVKHAAGLRATVVHEIKIGTFDYLARFPESKSAYKFGGDRTRRSISIRALAEKFYQIKKVDLGPQSERVYKNGLYMCCSILGDDRLVSAIMPEDIDSLRADLIASRAAATCNHYLSAFRGYMEYCENNGYTDKHLSASCSKFKVGRNDPDPLTHDDYQTIVKKGCRHPAQSNLITLAVYTGMRTGEICSLAWEDVDLNRGTITVRRNITAQRVFKLPKNDRERTISLMPPAVAALKSQQQYTLLMPPEKISTHLDSKKVIQEDVRPVFRPETTAPYIGHKSKENAWYVPTSLNTAWTTILKRAGVRHRSQYQTRHTFATWNLTAHGNIAFIAKQMGHADYSMLVKTYGRWMDDASDAEAEKVWLELQTKGHFAPNTPHQLTQKALSD
ncbi:site-specific integrase [Kistimonas scapharcae]|uniref:Site-specific integrase n=1 Tax=Kistimonas scapharcae TaxID=1036133 RepID=A0ABP8V933_9GAMM